MTFEDGMRAPGLKGFYMHGCGASNELGSCRKRREGSGLLTACHEATSLLRGEL